MQTKLTIWGLLAQLRRGELAAPAQTTSSRESRNSRSPSIWTKVPLLLRSISTNLSPRNSISAWRRDDCVADHQVGQLGSRPMRGAGPVELSTTDFESM